MGRPTCWGNQFVAGFEASIAIVGLDGLMYDLACPLTLTQAVAMYRADLEARLTLGPDPHPEDEASVKELRSALDGLRGKDLCCWCPLDAPCHADVLLLLANMPADMPDRHGRRYGRR